MDLLPNRLQRSDTYLELVRTIIDDKYINVGIAYVLVKDMTNQFTKNEIRYLEIISSEDFINYAYNMNLIIDTRGLDKEIDEHSKNLEEIGDLIRKEQDEETKRQLISNYENQSKILSEKLLHFATPIVNIKNNEIDTKDLLSSLNLKINSINNRTNKLGRRIKLFKFLLNIGLIFIALLLAVLTDIFASWLELELGNKFHLVLVVGFSILTIILFEPVLKKIEIKLSKSLLLSQLDKISEIKNEYKKKINKISQSLNLSVSKLEEEVAKFLTIAGSN